jgi:hypothetical protein
MRVITFSRQAKSVLLIRGRNDFIYNKKMPARGWGSALRMSVVAICVQKWDQQSQPKKSQQMFFSRFRKNFAVPNNLPPTPENSVPTPEMFGALLLVWEWLSSQHTIPG